nr:superoxide dismutase [Mesorhizobium loti]
MSGGCGRPASCCENYARADIGGVIIVFELDSVDEARRYTDDFPLSKAGLLEWHFLAFDPAPLPLEYLFDPGVDIAQPWDRTAA